MAEVPTNTLSESHSIAAGSLSGYLNWAVTNIWSNQSHSDRYGQFVILDQAFEVAFQNCSDFGEDAFFASLLWRAWSSFRCTCMMAMSGQSVEAYILMRECVEGALYALHIEANPQLGMVWLNRDRNEESRKDCKKQFAYCKVAKTLEVKSKWLYGIMQQLYEHTIDQGAHPNKSSVTNGVEMKGDIHTKTLSFRIVVGSPEQASKACEAASQVGACALHILQVARPFYFKTLGIDVMIDAVTREL
ncbi:hypothetical protein [Nitrosospira sp. Nsp13]|uniref:hypothetical protein n=1 Tax=Nitrosospira sp. Nsp13 TaxID=1855332 RepID=UPI000886F6ED|nr:hypothetical protein [Nitrosospira sp. Nsp13]SCY13778.1 hypothetical protein SAMN05216308_104222 [Nitrosospira sp. Nsp13]